MPTCLIQEWQKTGKFHAQLPNILNPGTDRHKRDRLRHDPLRFHIFQLEQSRRESYFLENAYSLTAAGNGLADGEGPGKRKIFAEAGATSIDWEPYLIVVH